MMTFKCKMCGGNLTFERGARVTECPYCGTTQTLPKLEDDKRTNMFDRANHFRRQNEYDKAAAIYEQILHEDSTDAEIYWSLVLCKYGIEYVEDPVTHKRVPTINRVQYTSILSDEDYEAALKNADKDQGKLYEAEACTIAEIQKGILDISRQEQPFDVFICYKETDDSGKRTIDSALAQDIYYQLVNEGYKVFFSRITLEDKLGQQYEPYIFAALNSAKVMLVVGTKPEYYNAVWVKNEWSRFLALWKEDRSRLIIPCYRDMDAYDLPDELSLFQSQDMSKIGFIQDLVRGIKKVLPKGVPSAIQSENSESNSSKKQEPATANESPVKKPNEADSHAIDLINKSMNEELEKCNSEIKDVEQQIASLQADFAQRKKSVQKKTKAEFDNTISQLQSKLNGLRSRYDSTKARFLIIRDNPEERKKWIDAFLGRENQYREAQRLLQNKEFLQARDAFRELDGLYDSKAKAEECEKAYTAYTYEKAVAFQKNKMWKEAYMLFSSISEYRDSAKRAHTCKSQTGFFDKLAAAYEEPTTVDRMDSVPQEEEKKKKGCLVRLIRMIIIIMSLILLAGIITVIVQNTGKNKEEKDLKQKTGQYDIAMVKENADYSYLYDRWNLYIATMLSDDTVKIECWDRAVSGGRPFKFDHDVIVLQTDDYSSGFTWIDEKHTAFSITMRDQDNSKWEEECIVTFSERKDVNEFQKGLVYRFDKWNIYRAIVMSSTVIRIEHWYRTVANDDDPFEFNRDVIVVNTEDSENSFDWANDEHTAFTITMHDELNEEWKNMERVAFSVE